MVFGSNGSLFGLAAEASVVLLSVGAGLACGLTSLFLFPKFFRRREARVSVYWYWASSARLSASWLLSCLWSASLTTSLFDFARCRTVDPPVSRGVPARPSPTCWYELGLLRFWSCTDMVSWNAAIAFFCLSMLLCLNWALVSNEEVALLGSRVMPGPECLIVVNFELNRGSAPYFGCAPA